MPGDDDSRQKTERTLRSFGSALGGLARRVGEIVSEVQGQLTVPEDVRGPLAASREHRLAGEIAEAAAVLRSAVEERGDHALLSAGLGLTAVHATLLALPLEPAVESCGEEHVTHLLEASRLLSADPGRALDEVRRATRGETKLLAEDDRELRYLGHVVAALAQEAGGRGERAVRELNKARTRQPMDLRGPLATLVRGRAVERLLIEDHALDARAWVSPDAAADAPDPVALALYARAAAACGDAPAAHEALDRLAATDEPALTASTRLACVLSLGEPVNGDVITAAQKHATDVTAPWSPERAVALARLRGFDPLVEMSEPDVATADEILDALVTATRNAPEAERGRYLAELAHAALRLDRWSADVRALLDAVRPEALAASAEEIRLARVLHRQLQAGDPDFDPGPPAQLRRGLAGPGPAGPDPLSPLRDPLRRRAVESAGRALASASYCLVIGDRDAAQEHLVHALVEAPGIPRARSELARLAAPPVAGRLEDLLSASTDLLVGVPARVLGVELTGVADALARVVAARERLARPLTIAIMGEFSSGKSTFVNALMGEEIAPMGLLPTTCTINVFRRGTSGATRIHYRDGTLSTLGAGQVSTYLAGLDAEEASRIHHVEIERTGTRLGDAAIVDTPGLNALDPYHERVAREFLDEADAVVWIFSATRGGAASEGAMLRELRAGGRQVLGVLNKVDTLEPAEREELSAYLREQLGEVLVEIIPLSATAALEYRVGEGSGDDPFAAVDRALESQFLHRARELKRAITARRLSDALDGASTSLQQAIDALEARARAGGAGDHDAGGEASLTRFADALREQVLGIDDLLTRECLGLGLARSGAGLVADSLDAQDLDYLAETFRDAALSALGRCLEEAQRDTEGERVARVLHQTVVPWLVGYVDGRVGTEEMGRWIVSCGPSAEGGENALRLAFRSALAPVADAWSERARAAVAELGRTRSRDLAAAASTPRAEALRLEVAVRAGVVALRDAARELEA